MILTTYETDAHPSTTKLCQDFLVKLQVGRVGLEPTTGGL